MGPASVAFVWGRRAGRRDTSARKQSALSSSKQLITQQSSLVFTFCCFALPLRVTASAVRVLKHHLLYMIFVYNQDGTIGSELVIRPLPVKHRSPVRKSSGVQLQGGSHDDELFMDEEDFRSADFMTPSPPSNDASSSIPRANDTENAILRRKRSAASNYHHSVGSHIVYKRAALQSESDYGIYSHIIFTFY